jgi:uncharacterized protein (TIGR02594 family)
MYSRYCSVQIPRVRKFTDSVRGQQVLIKLLIDADNEKVSQLTADKLASYLKGNNTQRKKLRGMICHSPSEWDKRLNAKFSKLKEENKIFFGKNSAYDRFIKFIEQFQFWGEVKELGSGPVWHFHPLKFIQHFNKYKPNPVLWMELARKESGIAVIKGPKHEPQIIEYHATTDLKATTDEVAWCSSFVNWTLKQVNLEGTNSADSQSWVNSSWETAAKKDVYGAVYVLKHPGNQGGHVSFIIGKAMDRVKYVLFGGNQHNSVDYSTFPNKGDVHKGTRIPSNYKPLDVDYALEVYVNIAISTATH